MRTIVVGDVHGCIDELDELLRLVEHRPEDRLVSLGDLMDRGPEPVACVRRMIELRAECVQSNHDEKHVRWRKHEHARRTTGKKNPVHFDSLREQQNLALRDDEIAWIASWPMHLALGQGWYAIHAGLEANKTFAEQKDSPALLRTRFLSPDGSAYSAKDPDEPDPTDLAFWTEMWQGEERIVYGHHIFGPMPRVDLRTPLKEQVNQTRAVICVGIDTGCYAGGRLTAMILEDDGAAAFVQAEALMVYEPLSKKYGPNLPKLLEGK